MTTIIIVESAIIIALLLIAFVIGSNSVILNKKNYMKVTEALNKAEINLKEAASIIRLKDIQIDFLKVAKDELYQKIHCKPHDSKGRFCKQKEVVYETEN